MELKVGDVVYLKSNPKNLMTVSYITKTSEFIGFGKKSHKKKFHDIGYSDDDLIVYCTWFDDVKFTGIFFKEKILTIESPGNPPPLFEVGDIVYLKSNPKMLMTVTSVFNKTEAVRLILSMNRTEEMWKIGFTDNDVILCEGFSNNAQIIIDYFISQVLAKKS